MCVCVQYVDPDIVARVKKVAAIFDASRTAADAGPHLVSDEV